MMYWLYSETRALIDGSGRSYSWHSSTKTKQTSDAEWLNMEWDVWRKEDRARGVEPSNLLNSWMYADSDVSNHLAKVTSVL